jgi:HEAT repeat protein
VIPRRPWGAGVGLWFFVGAATLGFAQSSVEELAARLESSDARTRRDAARELGEDGSSEAISVLNEAVRDIDRNVRRTVLDALLSVRRPDAAPGLIAFLEDELSENRRDAIGGLVDIHNREAPPGRRERAMDWLLRREQAFVLDPLRPVEPRIVEALSGRLTDDEEDNRELAAEALGALKAATAVGALAAAASEDLEDDVRREAIRALGAIGTDEAGERLLSMVEEPELREQVVRALGRFAYRPSVTALIGVYDADPESDVARDALEALARIGAEEARGTFYHELGSDDARRREFAAEGIGRIGDPALVDGMIRDFLREEDRRVQLAFCFALVRMGQPPFVDRIILSLSDSRVGEVASQYALELGRDFLPDMLRYLEDPDRQVRLELISLLEQLGDDSAIPSLRATTQDPDSEVADRARLAVRRLSESGNGR